METIIKKNICEQYLEDAGRYSLYVNRNIPVVDTEYLKYFVRRNKKPGIDLNQFRNNKERQ